MPHVRRRHHPREPQELDRGARPVSGAEPGNGCCRSQENGRARLSRGDSRHEALPAGLRSAAENRDVGQGTVRSNDGAVPALGRQPVMVDVWIPAAIMVGERPKPFSEYDAVLVNAMTTVAEAEALANWVALHKLRSRETDSISERRTK